MRKNLDELARPIIDIYNQIELDLLIEIAKRFDTAENITGILEWQLRKLQEIQGLNKDLIRIIAKYSRRTESDIMEMLQKAQFANIDPEIFKRAAEKGILSADIDTMMQSPAIRATLEKSFIELSETYKLINTRALESARQAYMDIINTAYIEVSGGIYDFNTSLRRSLQKMAANGFTGATYSRNGKIIKYSIEAAVRRDTVTAVHQLSNRVSYDLCGDMGADYVEISAHLGARVSADNPIANHAGWQGKVFKLNGSDAEYGNLKENTGYPGDILGLGGVNCRHRMFPFFPGISEPNPNQYDEEENRRAYALSQRQRKLERDIRNLKKRRKVAVASNDDVSLAVIDRQLREKYKEINVFCRQNGLKRDYTREFITDK